MKILNGSEGTALAKVGWFSKKSYLYDDAHIWTLDTPYDVLNIEDHVH